MNQATSASRCVKAAFALILASSLATGLVPVSAFADTSLKVTTAAAAQVSETVNIAGAQASGEGQPEGEATSEGTQSPTKNTNQAASGQAKTSNQATPTQATASVALGTDTTTVLDNGLVFVIDNATNTAAVTGWYGTQPAGNLTVPAEIRHNAKLVEVNILGGGGLLAVLGSEDSTKQTPASAQTSTLQKIQKNAPKPSATGQEGTLAQLPNLTSVSIPESITAITSDSFSDCPRLATITVAASNPTYASVDGVLYNKALTRALLFPESAEGVVSLPDQADAVPASALSYCANLSTLLVGQDNAVYTSINGNLYSKDASTLVACPGGIGETLTLPKQTTTIGPDALAGITTLKSIVVLGNVTAIDPTAFNDQAKQSTTIALPGGEDYETRKQVWENAGFKNFATPANPGDTQTPDQPSNLGDKPDNPTDPSKPASGLTYKLLEDYTLEASWTGELNPASTPTIPATAQLAGVSYTVSALAPAAFENQTSLTAITLPNSLTTIGSRAFAGTGLATLDIPTSITTIGDQAFANCPNLTRIVTHANTLTAAPTSLEGCTNLEVWCPYNEAETYPWVMGVFAANNHIKAYGVTLPAQPLKLEVGQTANLFEGAAPQAPLPSEITYAYADTCASVSSEGTVSAKAPGTAEVTATLTLGDVPLTQATRTLEVLPAAQSADPGAPQKAALASTVAVEGLPKKMPLCTMSLALNAVEPAKSGILPTVDNKGSAFWSLSPDGTLRIACAEGGVIAPFDYSDWIWSNQAPTTHWGPVRGLVSSIKMDAGVKAQDMYCWFAHMPSLLDATGVFVPEGTVQVGCLFFYSDALKTLPPDFSLPNSAANAHAMFSRCSQLQTLPAGFTIPEGVITVAQMFQYCTALTSLPVGFRLPASAKDVYKMFQSCTSLPSLPEGFTVPSTVTNMAYVFIGCSNLTVLPNSFDFPLAAANAADAEPPFAVSTPTPTYYAGTSEAVKNYNWTSQKRTLVSYNPATPPAGKQVVSFMLPDEKGSFTQLYTQKIVDSGGLVANPGNPGIKNTVLVAWYKEATLTTKFDFNRDVITESTTLYAKCYQSSGVLPTVDNKGSAFWSLSADGTLRIACADGGVIAPFDAADWIWSNPTPATHWGPVRGLISNIKMDASVKAQNMYCWFACMPSLLDATGVFVPEGTVQVGCLFFYSDALKTLSPDFSLPSSVTSAHAMFASCHQLQSLPAGFTIPDNGVLVSQMLENCFALTSLPTDFRLPASVKDVDRMFNQCVSLSSLPEGFAIPSTVTNMSFIFAGCSKLTSLPNSFDFPLAAANSADLAGMPPFKTDASTPTYYSGTSAAVKTYNWASQNRTLVSYDPATPPAGKQIVSFMLPDEKGSYTQLYTQKVVDSGGLVANPGDPGRFGYRFSGWYKGQEATPFDFTTPITAETTLQARFDSTPILSVDVPLTASVSLDALGKVTPEQTRIRSLTPVPVSIKSVACTSTALTQKVFDTSKGGQLAATLLFTGIPQPSYRVPFVDPSASAAPTSISGATIPAASSNSDPKDLPCAIGLDFTGAALHYLPNNESADVATLVWEIGIA